MTYSIPIFSCPGTNGMNPEISLDYNSQGNSGIGGYGWSLSSLSSISRTGKNIFHDGKVTPVEFTALNDKFTLDGMRLLPLNGNNGGNGTEYGGELETFTKIVSYSNNSVDNPDWFLVTTKDGKTMEFGHTLDSKILTDDGQNTMLWRLSRVIDINGNYIDFEYDNTIRDSRISKILYTGNLSTGLIPYNWISFSYSTKSDQNTVFESGASINSRFLLDKIIVNHRNDVNIVEIVKTYRLSYGFDNVNSILKEITEFGGDENAKSLNSTIFLYGNPTGSLVVETGAQENGECITGDFNADGKTDIIASSYYYDNYIKYSSGYKIFLDPQSNVPLYTKTLEPGHLLIDNKKIVNFLAGDYNGDGRDDIVHVKTKFVTYPSGYKAWLSERFSIEFTTATGSYTQEMPMPVNTRIHESGNFFIPGDFDGDGNQDYITILDYPNGPTTFFKAFLCAPSILYANDEIANFNVSTVTDYTANTIASANKILAFDFDGDGRQEVLVIKDQQLTILSIKSNEVQGSFKYLTTKLFVTSDITLNDKIFTGDFNGDRKNDLLVRKPNGTWKIYYSTGKNFVVSDFYFNEGVIFNGNYSDDKIVIGDFNGDGKSDVAHAFPIWVNGTSTTSKFSIYYSKGFGTYSFYNEQYLYNNVLPNVDLATGDFNGDGRTDILAKNFYFGSPDILYFKPGNQERLLQKITTGHNVTTSFYYKAMTDKTTNPPVYERTIPMGDPINQNPYNYVQLPMYLVSSIKIPDGTGGENITDFYYKDAVVHRQGKGFLGFTKLIKKNNLTDVTAIEESEINTQFAVANQVKVSSILTSTNVNLSSTLISNSFVDLSVSGQGKRFLMHNNKNTVIDDLSGNVTESVNSFDSYDNIISSITKVGYLSNTIIIPVETTVSTSAYSIHNTPVPAMADFVSTTFTRTGTPTVTETNTYTYNANGLQISETKFSGLPKSVTISYTYDNYGNPLSTTTSGTGVTPRVASSIYDTKGRYVTALQTGAAGALSQESFVVSSKWGLPVSKTTMCQTVLNEYNSFGKLKKSTSPDGTEISFSYNWQFSNIGNPNPNKLYYLLKHFSGGEPDSKTYVNKYGQEWRTEIVSMYGSSSKWHTVLTSFDNRGNIKTRTNSHFPNESGPIPIEDDDDPPPTYIQPLETPRITTNNYDVYNRILNTTSDLGIVNYSYSKLNNGNFKITVTNPDGQTTSKTLDASGKITTTEDNGGILLFNYDSRGNQIEVSQGSNSLTNSSYDEYGNQASLSDINAGTMQYSYNTFGELITQTDPLGNTYSMVYDALGRIVSRSGPEGTTTYEYFSGLGECNSNLKKVTGFNGIVQEYTYDNLNRLLTETELIDGITYTKSYTFTANSKLASTTYPSGLSVFQTYDNHGYLKSVFHNVGLPRNSSLFQNGWVNGEANYITFGLGNSKTTNNTYEYGYPKTTFTSGVQNLSYSFNVSNGNLLQRNDILKGQSENFNYDNLSRLLSVSNNGNIQTGTTYDANGSDSKGNIVAKTDAGYYKYRDDKIHALAYIMNTPVPGQQPVLPVPISQIPYFDQEISYTAFQKAATIGESSITGGPYLEIQYGADYERRKTQRYQGRLGLAETKYFIGNYEKQIINGITRELHYIEGGNGLCAIIVKESGIYNTYIVYTDHLGSLNTLTNASGSTIVAEQNFDAWGRTRNPNNWSQYTSNNSNPEWLYRGYTGHEMLPTFSLINMNGRMYDPAVGRMLSPDNYVPTPYGTQGYNRYNYALNNPLKYTDPDGNFIWAPIIVGAIIGAFTGAVSADIAGKNVWGGFFKGALLGGAGGFASIYAPIGILPGAAYGAASGAAIGALSGLLSGGNVGKSALYGGVLGGLSGGISGGREASQLGGNVWTGKRANEYCLVSDLSGLSSAGPDGAIPYTQENLENFYNANYAGTKGMSYMRVGQAPRGTKFLKDGSWVIKGKRAAAATQFRTWAHGNSSRVLFSKFAFQSNQALGGTMAHELGHVTHNYLDLAADAGEELLVKSGVLDTEGHLAINKMTYQLNLYNGWNPAESIVQSTNTFTMNTAQSKLYNPLLFLIKKLVFPW